MITKGISAITILVRHLQHMSVFHVLYLSILKRHQLYHHHFHPSSCISHTLDHTPHVVVFFCLVNINRSFVLEKLSKTYPKQQNTLMV